MRNSNIDASMHVESIPSTEDSSFGEILSSFERAHSASGGQTTGHIVSVGAENVLVNIGRKIEGSLPLAKWKETEQVEPKVGASIVVSIGPRNEEGYYGLSTIKVDRPRDWSGLQSAFADKRNIAGIVVEQVKGGFRVDIGMRAFMPASRSGVREACGARDSMPHYETGHRAGRHCCRPAGGC
jgi:small subunit ribosomal protein S1